MKIEFIDFMLSRSKILRSAQMRKERYHLLGILVPVNTKKYR